MEEVQWGGTWSGSLRLASLHIEYDQQGFILHNRLIDPASGCCCRPSQVVRWNAVKSQELSSLKYNNVRGETRTWTSYS